MNQQITKRRSTDTQADAPEPGSRAPFFALVDDEGKRLSLTDLEGKWVILYFYPKDNTPGCTREAIAFRDAAAELKRVGAIVVGVSRDSAESHTRFKRKHELNFALVCDIGADVHKAYGAFGEKNMYGKKTVGALRTTVLIRPDGVVARVFRNVKVDGHVEAIVEAIEQEAKAHPTSRR